MTTTGDKDRPRITTKRTSQARARARPKPKPTDGDVAQSAAAMPQRAARAPRVGEKRTRLNQQVVLELRALRATLTQCLDAFDLSVGGRIAEMLQSIEGDDALEQPPASLTVKTAQAVLDEISGLDVNPKKARPRDLRQIRRIVRNLKEILSA